MPLGLNRGDLMLAIALGGLLKLSQGLFILRRFGSLEGIEDVSVAQSQEVMLGGQKEKIKVGLLLNMGCYLAPRIAEMIEKQAKENKLAEHLKFNV